MKLKLPFSRKEREAAKAKKEQDALKAKTRLPDVVGMEYSRLCSTAGDKQYRIKTMQMELDCVNERLAQLNGEYDKAIEVHGAPQLPAAANVAPSPEGQQNATPTPTPTFATSNEVEKSETPTQAIPPESIDIAVSPENQVSNEISH